VEVAAALLREQVVEAELRALAWLRDWMPPQSRQQVAQDPAQLPQPLAAAEALLLHRLPRLDRKDAETFWWPGIP